MVIRHHHCSSLSGVVSRRAIDLARCGSAFARVVVRFAVTGESLGFVRGDGSNLVDPASSHTLVSKIKPCMSKYKRKRNCEWLIISVIVYLIVFLYG